ncbi:unnamed protein product [marine sediment metagenome]|uniref:Uncharacterized protein n=1 Tax=marine sediment metagenome TaxID=412755 RepID=X0RXC9_9ZZZZ
MIKISGFRAGQIVEELRRIEQTVLILIENDRLEKTSKDGTKNMEGELKLGDN